MSSSAATIILLCLYYAQDALTFTPGHNIQLPSPISSTQYRSTSDDEDTQDILTRYPSVSNDQVSTLKINEDDGSSIKDITSLPNVGGTQRSNKRRLIDIPVHVSVSEDAGPLYTEELCDDGSDLCTIIPHKGRYRKKVLVLCTGGTLTMQNDPTKGNSLAPVQGALTSYLAGMTELTSDPEMPEITSHEYSPLIDSSDVSMRTCDVRLIRV